MFKSKNKKSAFFCLIEHNNDGNKNKGKTLNETKKYNTKPNGIN